MSFPLQIVLILDVDDKILDSTILPLLPPDRSKFLPLRLSDFGAPLVSRDGPNKSPVDWNGLAAAVVRMVNHAKDQGKGSGWPIQYYITGFAPLPVFMHLGMELSAWASPQTLLNRRKNAIWDVLSLSTGQRTTTSHFFDRVTGLDRTSPAQTTGHLAIFISLTGAVVPVDQIRRFIQDRGEQLAEIIEVQTGSEKTLDAASTSLAADELAKMFSKLPSLYPHSSGTALFIYGPATLAYLIGRAINPHILTNILVANFNPPSYEMALKLPWYGKGGMKISETLEGEQNRSRVLDILRQGIDEVRLNLAIEDLPKWILSDERQKFLTQVGSMVVSEKANDEEYRLNILGQSMTIGRSLLEALRECEPQQLRRIGQLLFLHEVYHFGQNVKPTNYRDVGRAGVVLEELDYWADIVAIESLSRFECRRSSAPPNSIVTANIECALLGMQAFDRFEFGQPLQVLYERRFRRYLIWHLQKARASYLKRAGDISELLSQRVVVELAPLIGHLDARFDKVVQKASEGTELFLVVGKRLCRHSSGVNIDVPGLVEAVRTYDGEKLKVAMDYLINEHPELLVSWTV